MVIANDISSLLPADSFRHYRDELNWWGYPVYPPGARCNDPGKQPAFKSWWSHSPHDVDIQKYFSNGSSYNIGVCPKSGLVFVDLDSKPDQGASVAKFLSETRELDSVPRHQTRGGVHLVFRCPDVPQWKNPKTGKPFHDRLISKINPQVNAEFFHSEHNNIVLPPSIHPTGFRYTWTVFGLVPEVEWKWIQEIFHFEEPAAHSPKAKGKAPSWDLKFRGDLQSLDLIKLLEELGHKANLEDADECRYIVHCPWRDSEHSDPADETGAKVWQPPGKWPGFHCHHNSCEKRGLREVLEWAETKSPGIVDRLCAHSRVWDRGARHHTNAQGLPRVLHAEGRLESTVYTEVGEIIAPAHVWYTRSSAVNTIEQVPSGFIYPDDPNGRYQVAATSVGFRELTGLQAKGSLEQFMEPGTLRNDGDGNVVFAPKSFSTDFCAGLIQSEQLKGKLPRIARLLTVPLPFRIGDRLVYPKKNYDPRFATFLLPNAPELYPMPIVEAKAKIETLLCGFCFTNEQSKTHAIARLLTPFARALIGWTARVPLWFFSANRPRSGKDYLSGTTLIIYEGMAFEDLPIGHESEETAKRIMSAARNGRRFMHFSNCQIYLQDQYLTQTLTNPVINGRRLGSNEATSDLSVPNEMEFSISGNVGLTYRDDLVPRMRKIELAFFEEDANARTFPDKFLHRTIKNDRAGFLSAIAAIYREWARAGFPNGATPFSSFPEWAGTVGGVMAVAGYGDPCLPWKGKYDDHSGDIRARAMTELFKVCFAAFPNQEIKKPELYQTIDTESAENETLSWFGALHEN